LERMKPQPQFVTISWEETEEKGSLTMQASLCLRHRKEMALKHPSARGSGRLGDGCDLCEGRRPRRHRIEVCPNAKQSPRVP
jgi:hypothetical protein